MPKILKDEYHHIDNGGLSAKIVDHGGTYELTLGVSRYESPMSTTVGINTIGDFDVLLSVIQAGRDDLMRRIQEDDF